MQLGRWVDGDLCNGWIVRVANSLVFTEPVFNCSGAFPFLWDEIRIPIRLGSDRQVARAINRRVADEVVGPHWRDRRHFMEGAGPEVPDRGRQRHPDDHPRRKRQLAGIRPSLRGGLPPASGNQARPVQWHPGAGGCSRRPGRTRLRDLRAGGRATPHGAGGGFGPARPGTGVPR